MYDGAITYSDGGQLRQLFRVMRLPEAYFEAGDDYAQGKYAETLEKCQQLLEEGNHQAPIYELCWEALEKKGNDKEALAALQRASELGFQHHGLPMKIDDLERAIERTL